MVCYDFNDRKTASNFDELPTKTSKSEARGVWQPDHTHRRLKPKTAKRAHFRKIYNISWTQRQLFYIVIIINYTILSMKIIVYTHFTINNVVYSFYAKQLLVCPFITCLSKCAESVPFLFCFLVPF